MAKIMSTSAKNRKRREKLFAAQDGRCFWCQTPVVEMGLLYREMKNIWRMAPPNMATLDHLFDRTHPRRNKPVPGERRYVLACYACNHYRGTLSARGVYIFSMTRRTDDSNPAT